MTHELVWKDEWDSSDALRWLNALERKVDHETYMYFHEKYMKLDMMLYESNEGVIFHNDAGEVISSDEFVDEIHDVVWRIFELASK